MFLKYFIFGFIVKVIASFDDTLTRIPIITHLTQTRLGKVAFSIGNLMAITLAIILAISFSTVIRSLAYTQYVASGLIFALAIVIYFNLFVSKVEKKAEEKLIKPVTISTERFIKLIGIGFVVSFITLIDDTIVLIPLFLGDISTKIYATTGVYAATILQIIVVVFFAEKADKIKYKKEIASASLIILGILILFGVI